MERVGSVAGGIPVGDGCVLRIGGKSMPEIKTASLVNREKVIEKLIERFGVSLVWQVEQLSEHIFRAFLNDGRVVVAVARENATLDIRELEDVC